MKPVYYLLLSLLFFSSCDELFEIEQTVHILSIRNESNTDFEVQWGIKSLEGTISLESDQTEASSGSASFLSQDGENDQLEVDEIYDHFDKLVLFIGADNGSNREIELKSLQIDPEVTSDNAVGTREWYYTFAITNTMLE